MARTADRQGDSPHTADDGQHRPNWKQREPEAAAVVLTPKGQRRWQRGQPGWRPT
jgi:hypothetical protein